MELKQILEAKERLIGVTHNHLPLEYSNYFSACSGAQIYLKCENRQKTGSFKVRGAYNKIVNLTKERKVETVIAASAGNHAQGVAFAATEVGVKSIIVMPRSAPLAKISATKGYGAEVVLHGEFFDDAYSHAKELEQQTNAVFIEAYNDIDIIAGQGTIGVEIINDMKDVDIVVVPTGGGGLLAGVSKAIKSLNPRVHVIGVQAEKANALVRSFASKTLSPLADISTIADGIAIKKPGSIPFEIIKENVDEMVTVTDDEIASVMIELLERTKQVVEPSGASALAAIHHHKIDVKGKKVVSILTGGNIDVAFIHKIIERGLLKRGRQLPLTILMHVIPGSLEKISGIIAKTHASIIDVRFDRTSTQLPLNHIYLHLTCETTGHEHGDLVISELEKNGFKNITQ